MSRQLQFLISAIDSVRNGRESAVAVLREICKQAVEAAPSADLIRIGDCLIQIGEDMERAPIAGN